MFMCVHERSHVVNMNKKTPGKQLPGVRFKCECVINGG